MNIGMLWFDNDRQTALIDKVSKAAEYYRRKYGSAPDLCMVHPSMLAAPGAETAAGSGRVAIQAHRSIRPGHLWIGEADKN